MDAPLKAKSGHQGTAMSLAPLAHVLYSRVMKFDPARPDWSNRDRFILSIGHASILQYAMLYLNGFGLEMDDIKSFRQWGSLTPGHPEVGHTVGVEVTTGPLGQGFANAVGMAIAESHQRAVLGADSVDHNIWTIVGDGCLMEGISHEAASLAGHLKLDRLVCVFDDNRITIDGSTDITCTDDVVGRFVAYGWNVVVAGEIGEDVDALEKVLVEARDHAGAPTLVVLRTHIGHPSPDLTDKHEAHGNPFTADHVTNTKNVMGIPDEPFWAPADLVAACRDNARRRGAAAHDAWAAGADVAAVSSRTAKVDAAAVRAALPVFGPETVLATRQAFQKVLEATGDVVPQVLAGAADLTGNTGAKLGATSGFSATNPAGQQVYYGIREHAMGAAAVGIALHGGAVPVVGTFFVFADYMKPAIRLAALSSARCVFVFSHDSVGVGEDGPTHQPIEHLASLRSIPGLQVIRPSDPAETGEAWVAALEYDGPTALILSRQNVQSLTDGSAVRKGAAVIRSVPSPVATIVGTGSEVGLAHDAALALEADGVAVNVVSMPSWDRFLALPETERDTILPPTVPSVGVEAGSTFGWSMITDHQVGIDRFGASAPGGVVMEKLGVSVANVVATVKAAIAR